MKVIKILAATLIAVVLLFVGFLAFFVSPDFSVTRSIQIEAPKAYVFPAVNKLKNWKYWMIWAERDPQMNITYSGPDTGAGAKTAWISESQGNGEMECIQTKPNDSVEYRLTFPEMGMSSQIIMSLEEVSPTVTRVTWNNNGSVGSNPMYKLFAMNMDRMVGPDFEAGLNNMKKWVEAKPEQLEVEITTETAPKEEQPGLAAPEETQTDQKEGQPVDK